MAERDNPELRPFVLSNVRLTGTELGAGAYGRVDEVEIPVEPPLKPSTTFYTATLDLETLSLKP